MGTTSRINNLPIDLPYDEIASVCEKYRVAELSIFGSVLRDDFGSDSDIDFLVLFKNDDCGPWMSKFMDLEEEFGRLLGRKVEVVAKRSVQQSENYIRRKHILGTAKVIYVA